MRQGWQTFILHGTNSRHRTSTTWWTERDIYCCTCITRFFRSWRLCAFEYNTNDIYGLRWLLKFVLCILWLKIINVIIQIFLGLCYIHSKIKLQSVKLYKSNFIFPFSPSTPHSQTTNLVTFLLTSLEECTAPSSGQKSKSRRAQG